MTVGLTVYMIIGILIGLMMATIARLHPEHYRAAYKTDSDILARHWFMLWMTCLFLWPLVTLAVILMPDRGDE